MIYESLTPYFLFLATTSLYQIVFARDPAPMLLLTDWPLVHETISSSCIHHFSVMVATRQLTMCLCEPLRRIQTMNLVEALRHGPLSALGLLCRALADPLGHTAAL